MFPFNVKIVNKCDKRLYLGNFSKDSVLTVYKNALITVASDFQTCYVVVRYIYLHV